MGLPFEMEIDSEDYRDEKGTAPTETGPPGSPRAADLPPGEPARLAYRTAIGWGASALSVGELQDCQTGLGRQAEVSPLGKTTEKTFTASPEGAAAYSLGRKPQVHNPNIPKALKGRQQTSATSLTNLRYHRAFPTKLVRSAAAPSGLWKIGRLV